MSGKLTGMVFDRYPDGGGEMLLALKLADNAHDDGTHIFPSVDTMAEKTRQSRRAVQYQLKRMREAGWLILVRAARGGREGSGRPAEYRINPDWIKGADFASLKLSTETTGPNEKGADFAPNYSEKGASGDINGRNPEHERVQNEAEMGATAIAPEPSVNPHEPSVNRVQARDDKTSPTLDGEKSNHETQPPGFERFWEIWPAASGRKQARDICFSHWLANGLEADQHLIVAHVEAMKRTPHWKTGGDPTPIRYLEQRRWRDGMPVAADAAEPAPDWWLGGEQALLVAGEQFGARPKHREEPLPVYRAVVARAAGKGPWIDAILLDAQRAGGQFLQTIVATLGEALMPVDWYAS